LVFSFSFFSFFIFFSFCWSSLLCDALATAAESVAGFFSFLAGELAPKTRMELVNITRAKVRVNKVFIANVPPSSDSKQRCTVCAHDPAFTMHNPFARGLIPRLTKKRKLSAGDENKHFAAYL
jgi:hypothetical protein